MALSAKAINEKLRNKYMETVKNFLAGLDEEVLVTNSNEFAIPCVDENGNDNFVTIKFSVPTGSRDGEPYDGYGEAESYKMKLDEKAETAKKKAAAKAEKIARDKKAREAKAAAKAERMAKVEE